MNLLGQIFYIINKQRFFNSKNSYLQKVLWGIFPIIIFLSVALPYLSHSPRWFLDETWLSLFGYGLYHDGRLYHPVIRGWGGMDRYFLLPALILPVTTAIFFKLFGYGIFQARLASICMGCIVIMFVYRIGKKIFGFKPALLASILLAVYPWFQDIASRVRPEIYSMAIGFFAIFLSLDLWDKKYLPKRLFLVGMLMGVSVYTHPQAVLFTGIVILLIIWNNWKFFFKNSLLLGLGLILGILPYILYILYVIAKTTPEQVSFSNQLIGYRTVGIINLIEGHIGYVIYLEKLRWKNYLRMPVGLPLIILYGIVICQTLFRRNKTRQAFILALIYILYVFLLPLITANNCSRYLAIIEPIPILLFVRLLSNDASFFNASGSRWEKINNYLRNLFRIGYVIMLIGFLSVSIYAKLFFRRADISKIINQISEIVPNNVEVTGEIIFGLFPEKLKIVYPVPWKGFITNEKKIAEAKTPYILSSLGWGANRGLWLPPPEIVPDLPITKYAQTHGELIVSFFDKYYGPIRLYKLKSNSNSVNSQSQP